MSRAPHWRMLLLVVISCGYGLALPGFAWAQSQNTEHTLSLDAPENQPSARLEEIDWMQGEWRGEGFGGLVEECWLTPSAGTMLGTFKIIHDGEVSMYEFMRVIERAGSLVLELKHFNADFSGWEEKDDFVSFPLVRLEKDAVYFSGLSYRLEDGAMVAYVALSEGDELVEARLPMRSMR